MYSQFRKNTARTLRIYEEPIYVIRSYARHRGERYYIFKSHLLVPRILNSTLEYTSWVLGNLLTTIVYANGLRNQIEPHRTIQYLRETILYIGLGRPPTLQEER